MLDAGEECDDSNSISGDGCSNSCKIESGFACPVVGQPCLPFLCGDGILVDPETCDDQSDNGEGCSAGCSGEAPGWTCTHI